MARFPATLLLWTILGCESRVQVLTSSPPREAGVSRPIEVLAAGHDHLCVLRSRELLCTGDNASFQLATTEASTRWGLERSLPFTTELVDVTAGLRFTCALTPRGIVLCWGEGDRRQLGSPTPRTGSPVPVATDGAASRLMSGAHNACALLNDGALLCWGANDVGQLGQGETEAQPEDRAPTPMLDGRAVRDACIGEAFICVIDSAGTLYCMGSNTSGELASSRDPEVEPYSRTPNRVPGGPYFSVSCGHAHACAIHATGDLYCWGNDRETSEDGGASPGPVGFSGSGLQLAPALIDDGASTWSAVATGHSHTCGIQEDGSLWCWGRNVEGQLGLPRSSVPFGQALPQRIGDRTDWRRVAAGAFYTCAVDADSRLWCTGDNRSGTLGLGREVVIQDEFVEVPVP